MGQICDCATKNSSKIMIDENNDDDDLCKDEQIKKQNNREILAYINPDKNKSNDDYENKEIQKEKMPNLSIQLEEKEKQLNERENTINLKEDELSIKEKSLNEKEEINKQKEKKIDIEGLNERENNVIQKENELNQKEKNLIQREQANYQKEKEVEILYERESKINQKESQLSKKEKYINEKEEIINKKEQDIIKNEKEKICKEKEEKLSTKEKSLNEREEIINKKEKENMMYYCARTFKENLNKIKKDIASKEPKLSQLTLIFQEEKKAFEKYKNEVLDKYLQNLENEKPILIGLNDIGKTCYMNAALQCLSNINELTEYFLNEYRYDSNNKNKKMSNVYYEVIKNLWNKENNNNSYSPSTFKNVLCSENDLFEGNSTNDSKDLINFLIERLHDELNEITSENDNQYLINENDQFNEKGALMSFLKNYKLKYNSIISDLFYGIYETKSICHGCRTMTFNFQIYNYLEFQLEEINNYCFNEGKRKALKNEDGSNPDIDIYECFDFYQKLYLVNGDNQLYCNKCGELKDSFYRSLLYSAPKIMVINLNRGEKGEYKCNIIFHEELNIFNYVQYKHGPNYFELFGVIVHSDPSSADGKFVTYCKNRMDNNWYLYDDESVTKCNQSKEYLKSTPYILFYKKK